MKKDRMLELADFLDSLPEEKMDMGNWYMSNQEKVCESTATEDCGTSACIAGWTVLHSGKCFIRGGTKIFNANGSRMIRKGCSVFPFDYAKRYLGLSKTQARNLFYEENWPEKFKTDDPVTIAMAVKRLRHMAETGE